MSKSEDEGLYGAADNETLLKGLKHQASRFSMFDIIKIRAYMIDNVKHLPEKYQKTYSVDLFEYLYRTLHEIKDAEISDSKVSLDRDKLKETNACIDKLAANAKHDEVMFTNFLRTVALYLIFIGNKPIHPRGMQFPGGLKIIFRDNGYYCPAKEKQSEIEMALCKFCICKDLNEIE
ncbi:uncharacterized protein (UPF0305 family) [Methanohalophilus levihalophilus]|uniref:DUF2115 domain-containing protein n=1 Tax=Methanohalophilus levihalophilus TaxID=1431282 RepID=UPI001AE64497|nr:DUF2115 domain-containing protein [Methanohalophilus levihalophilus]MBP2029578.1 uncharacterized protein (UPF0305 family) [Methanohalophilus levihalophilus]